MKCSCCGVHCACCRAGSCAPCSSCRSKGCSMGAGSSVPVLVCAWVGWEESVAAVGGVKFVLSWPMDMRLDLS
jgi:hypothetical protein